MLALPDGTDVNGSGSIIDWARPMPEGEPIVGPGATSLVAGLASVAAFIATLAGIPGGGREATPASPVRSPR